MVYTTINKAKVNMNTVIYNGNAGTQSITGVGFQPDLTWIKNRAGSAENHAWTDVVRGVTKTLSCNSTGAETTVADGLTAFGADGFTLGASDQFNGSSGRTYVSWNWKAGGTGSANSSGSIASTVSANTTAGFSVVEWSGSAANATIGHGLGAVPSFIITKDTNDTYNWGVYHQSMGNTKYLYLNTSGAEATSTSAWNDTTPTATVFSVGNAGATNASGTNNMIAYCFAEKPGYSKFSAYKGNGNANGAFVYTGFRPSFILIRNKTDSGEMWEMFDDKRLGYNEKNYRIYSNASDVQDTSIRLDMLSNGFKIRTTGSHVNENGDTMVYAAFGQSLVGTNDTVANAR